MYKAATCTTLGCTMYIEHCTYCRQEGGKGEFCSKLLPAKVSLLRALSINSGYSPITFFYEYRGSGVTRCSPST